jgi:DNA-directed RNA polymerase subunit RPC12/RpoP
MMEILNDTLARKTVRHYACSACWGELELIPVETGYKVLCRKCGEETKGYVTQNYVNRRRAESAFEEVNATHMLMRAGVLENPHAGKSTEQLLKELGF